MRLPLRLLFVLAICACGDTTGTGGSIGSDGNINTSGQLAVGGSLIATGAVTTSAVNVKVDGEISDTFSADVVASFGRDLSVGGDVKCNGPLTVGGTLTYPT